MMILLSHLAFALANAVSKFLFVPVFTSRMLKAEGVVEGASLVLGSEDVLAWFSGRSLARDFDCRRCFSFT